MKNIKKILIVLNLSLLILTNQPVFSSNRIKTPDVYVGATSHGTSAIFELNPALTRVYNNAQVTFFSNTPAAFPDNIWTPPADVAPVAIDGAVSNFVPNPLLPGRRSFVPLTGTTRELNGKVCLSGSLTCQRFSLDIIQYGYVSNFGSVTPTIAMASLDTSGSFNALTVQETPGVTINEPYQIALNRPETRAYIVSRFDSQVFQCLLNSDQSFRACADSGNTGVAFDSPSGIVLNNQNTYAYITNQEGGTTEAISVCPLLPNGSFGACVASENTSFNFDSPNGIALNPAGTRAYVAESRGGSNIVMCPVNANGNLGDCVDAGAGFSFNSPIGLAIPLSGHSIYVTNFGNSTVSRCSIDSDTGLFTACEDTGATGLSDPFGLSLTRSGNAAYVVSTGSNTITRFPIGDDGMFGTGVPRTGPNLDIPIWITLD